MTPDNHRFSLFAIFGGIAFYCALQHLTTVVGAVSWVLSLFSPLFLGCAIAFILNVPMAVIERKLFPPAPKRSKWARPVSLLLTLVALVGVLVIASVVVVPNVRQAVSTLPEQISAAFDSASAQFALLTQDIPELAEIIKQLNLDWSAISQQALAFAKALGNSALLSGGSLVGGLVTGVASFVMGLIFAFYILVQKEKLGRNARMTLYAFLPKGICDELLRILALSQKIFSSFLSGQCLESVILGLMFVVAMTLFGMPYALLVGVLVAITALIPLVGAFIGCTVGVLLIALTNPMQAVVFLIMFLVIQQIEGNLIYPYVVGSSVGLPSFWVLVAVFLGGSLLGVVGMLVFIPLFSVGYTLLREVVYKRLDRRGISL